MTEQPNRPPVFKAVDDDYLELLDDGYGWQCIKCHARVEYNDHKTDCPVPALIEVERLRGLLKACQDSEFHGMHQQMVGLHHGLDANAAEVERLKGLLRRLEWVPGAYEPSRARSCPVCWTVEGTPHDEERCWLAAEL